MGLFSLSDAEKRKLKEEILADISAKIKPLLEEQGKSVKKDGERLVKEFSKEIKDERKGLEAQMKELLEEFKGVKSQSEKVSGEAIAVKKDSERIKVYAEEAKTKADGAEKGVQAIEAVAKRANELCDTIEAKLKGYTDLAVVAAVEKCTATVDSVMDSAVQKARDEYKLNLDDSVSLLEETNTGKINALFDKLKGPALDELKKLTEANAKGAEALKSLTEQARSILAQLNDDRKYFRETLDFMRANMPHVAYYLKMSSLQMRMIKELYGRKYNGDIARLKKDLTDVSDKLRAKKSLSPQELEFSFAAKELQDMEDHAKKYKLRTLQLLFETVCKMENLYTNNSSSGSGKQNKH